MSKHRMTVFLTLVFVTAASCAEILHNIEPLDTLGAIRMKYPNAMLTRVKAAWVTKDQDFFRLEGQGFPGKLYIAFDDSRPMWRDIAAREQGQAAASSPAPSSKLAEIWANEGDDDALTVSWVRWAPESPIPLERYKSKYGEPTKCDFKADTMQPYCDWTARGLLVSLSDDKKLVYTAEAQFTKAELVAAYRSRGLSVPPWLRDEVKTSPSPSRPAASTRKASSPKS